MEDQQSQKHKMIFKIKNIAGSFFKFCLDINNLISKALTKVISDETQV